MCYKLLIAKPHDWSYLVYLCHSICKFCPGLRELRCPETAAFQELHISTLSDRQIETDGRADFPTQE